MIRGAADRLLKSLTVEERTRLGLPASIGDDTGTALDVLQALSSDGRAQAVRTAIADERRAWLRQKEEKIRSNPSYTNEKRRSELKKLTGWRPRFARFE